MTSCRFQSEKVPYSNIELPEWRQIGFACGHLEITIAVFCCCLQISQSICKGFRIRGRHMRYCFLSKAWKEISWFVSNLLETLINCWRQISSINNHGFSHHSHLDFSRLWQISILCSFECKAKKHIMFYIYIKEFQEKHSSIVRLGPGKVKNHQWLGGVWVAAECISLSLYLYFFVYFYI